MEDDKAKTKTIRLMDIAPELMEVLFKSRDSWEMFPGSAEIAQRGMESENAKCPACLNG